MPTPRELTPQFLEQASLAIDLLQCQKPADLLVANLDQYGQAQKQFMTLFAVFGTHFVS